jgi:hypothetical protein
LIPNASPLFLSREYNLSFVTLTLLIHGVKQRMFLIYHLATLTSPL